MITFQSKYIDTVGHCFDGMSWPFRGCEVELRQEGFCCSCQEKPRWKCNHIKSVEFALLGVNAKEYAL